MTVSVLDTFNTTSGSLDGRTPPTDGGLGAAWVATGWTIAANVVKANPTLGDEMLTNGSMEAATTWAAFGVPTSQAQSNEQAYAGTYSWKIVGNNSTGIQQSPPLVPGAWYRYSGYTWTTAGSAQLQFDSGTDIATTTAAWTQHIVTRRRTANSVIAVVAGAAGSTIYADSLSVKELVLAECFATLDSGVSGAAGFQVSAAVNLGVTAAAMRCGGVVMNLDSTAAPSNFVLCYTDGTNVYLDKCIGGVYVNLVKTMTTFSEGARIGISRTGNTYSAIYNGALVGTAQTISNAEIVDNTIHGLFGTMPEMTFDNFRLQAVAAKTLTIIGDSISDTVTTEGDWPRDLVRDSSVGLVIVKNHAVSGKHIIYAATNDMDDQIVAAASDNADVAIIMLGTNDTDNAAVTAEYQENVLELATSNPNATIYACGIMPRTSDAARTANNPRIAAAAAAAGVDYWDTDGWINATSDTSDGLHPNANGALKILLEILTREDFGRLDTAGTGMSVTATDYCTVAQLKARLGIDDVVDDTVLAMMISAVSTWIEKYTGRKFYTSAADETRYFTADDSDCVWPGDIVSVTTLATDEDGDRTYERTWAATDFDLLPANAAFYDEPYTKVQVTPRGSYTFPELTKGVKIIGKFGWSACPGPVSEACLLQCERVFKRRDAPFGVAGSAELGQLMVIPRLDPDVRQLLDPYRVIIGAQV